MRHCWPFSSKLYLGNRCQECWPVWLRLQFDHANDSPSPVVWTQLSLKLPCGRLLRRNCHAKSLSPLRSESVWEFCGSWIGLTLDQLRSRSVVQSDSGFGQRWTGKLSVYALLVVNPNMLSRRQWLLKNDHQAIQWQQICLSSHSELSKIVSPYSPLYCSCYPFETIWV